VLRRTLRNHPEHSEDDGECKCSAGVDEITESYFIDGWPDRRISELAGPRRLTDGA